MLSKYELCKIKASQDWTYKMEIGLTTPYKESIIPTDPPQIFKQTKAFQLRFYYDREMKREIALFGCWEIRKKKIRISFKNNIFRHFFWETKRRTDLNPPANWRIHWQWDEHHSEKWKKKILLWFFPPEVPEIPTLIFLENRERERERETKIVGICVYREWEREMSYWRVIDTTCTGKFELYGHLNT